MILNLYIENEYLQPKDWRFDLLFRYIDESNDKVVAEGVHGVYSSIHTTLKYENAEYVFSNPKKMDRIMLNTKYPLCSKRKWAFGCDIKSTTDKNISFYPEAITCKKRRFIFDKNMGLKVIKIDDKYYTVYCVGFSNEPHHYYCINDENNKTIAIIKRLYQDDIRAKLYIENEKDLFITLLACTIELINYIYVDANQSLIDKSAGNYISILKEEKEMLDKSFIDRVINNNH